MTINIIHSLKFQIAAVLLLLLSLFSFAILYTLYTIDERENEMAALHLLHRMQLITNYMTMQSNNYLQNAPTNTQDYKRDISFYYKDLKGQLNNKNDIITCFADEHLPAYLVDMDKDINLKLGSETKHTLEELQKSWNQYYLELQQTMGESEDLPKLAAAARYISNNQQKIKQIEEIAVEQMSQDLNDRINGINLVNKVVLGASLLIALMTLAGFYIKVIMPLNKAVDGFDRVARGDFGHQVTIRTHNEIASITQSFNHLSLRLYAIFKLIDRVQQGSEMDETLGFIAEEFGSILPINWTSVLLHNGDAKILELQKVFLDGKVQLMPSFFYSVEGTLLEQAIQSDKPLHISNVDEVARQKSEYVFLSLLAEHGMKSSIFLNLSDSTKIIGILVFASRQRDAYNNEHIELLNNIAHLVTHSFGKTIRMAEQKSLAAIGEFTSDIVHEVRNPLTTIGLALNYFSKQQLDEDGQEWVEIAGRESERMGRLLEDVLLYAKPVKLELESINLYQFMTAFIQQHQPLGEDKSLKFILCNGNIENEFSNKLIKADPDRVNQILLNIYRNAIDAADPGSKIQCILAFDIMAHTVNIKINNQGEMISKAVLNRIGEPFFTTKRKGTGLGMGIVKRIVEAHSGNLTITSTETEGTSVTVTLPVIN
jgi:signal transduction histidine kinase